MILDSAQHTLGFSFGNKRYFLFGSDKIMQTIETNWEDEENNRQVAVSVGYTRQGNGIEIHAVTPKQVTFLCPQTSSPLRSIGVWTDKGRELLADKMCNIQLAEQVEAILAV
jgi:hypothetical protein